MILSQGKRNSCGCIHSDKPTFTWQGTACNYDLWWPHRIPNSMSLPCIAALWLSSYHTPVWLGLTAESMYRNCFLLLQLL